METFDLVVLGLVMISYALSFLVWRGLGERLKGVQTCINELDDDMKGQRNIGPTSISTTRSVGPKHD